MTTTFTNLNETQTRQHITTIMHTAFNLTLDEHQLTTATQQMLEITRNDTTPRSHSYPTPPPQPARRAAFRETV